MSSNGYKRQGSEFRVNTATAGSQTDAAMATLASGGFILTWTDASAGNGDTSGTAVRAQIYDAAGVAVGGEFLANTATLNNQSRSTVTGLASGGFVISWSDESLTGGDASGPSIKAQVFDAAGLRVGGEFLVNTTTASTQTDAAVTALAGGGFVVSWADSSATGGDKSGVAIRAQVFNAGGAKVGGEFLVNTAVTSDQLTPTIAPLASGGFVVSWTDGSRIGGDTSGYGIKAQIFAADGSRVGSEFLVNTAILINQNQPVVASLASGKFVIAWTDGSREGGDPSATAIKAQIFNLDGTRSGGEFLVNTTTLYTQQQPSITALPGGGFAVGWTDNSIRIGDYSGNGIKMQVFDDNGARIGTEFNVNTTTTGNQEQPVITALASGALVIGWTDYSGQGGDASGAGIKAQIIAPSVGAITDIALSMATLSEASAQNTVAAVFSTNGAINGAFSYELLGDSSGGAFRIEGDHLVVADSLKLDYETATSVDITVRASDGFGNSYSETLIVGITNALRESRFSAGAEIRVNTATANDQATSNVVRLENGGFVVSWIDNSLIGGDATGYGVKAQVFDASGAAVGGEFLVNTVTAANQNQPTLGALGDGGFVAVWTDASGRNGAGTVIVGQRYDALGVRTGGEFLVGAATSLTQIDASVTGLVTGGFVVGWTDSSGQFGDTTGSAILARRFDASGAAVGGPMLVNTATTGTQDQSSVAALDTGGFVVTWRDGSGIGGDSSSSGIKARLFDAAGNGVGNEFLVNTQTRSTQLQPVVTTLAGGGFVIAWTDNSGLGGDADYYGVKAQVFDNNGIPVGGELLVNTSTANGQLAPTIAPLASGGFVVGWYDFSGNGGEAGGAGIRAQAFNASGVRLGTEIAVNQETLGAQADPSLAALASGAFVVTYTDYSGNGGDATGTSIKARVFTPLIDPNAPPALRAVDDNVTGAEDQPLTIIAADILSNDANGNGGILVIESVTAVVGGTVALDVDGNILFTPNAGFDGRAVFDYRVGDGTGATDIGRVFVQVAGINSAPTANPDAVVAAEDGTTLFGGSSLIGNDTDPDTGDRLTVTAVSPVSDLGVVLGLNAGTVSYATGTMFNSLAAGQTLVDHFSYTVSDVAGLASSALVTVTIQGANDAPHGLALSNGSVAENSANGTIVGTAAALDVDNGDSISYLLTNNAGGRFAIDATTGVITVANGALLDYETAASHQIGVRAQDNGGLATDLTFTIALLNLPEPRSYTGTTAGNSFTAPTNDLWTISGLGGNDILTGNASSDTIYGGTGADTIDGAGGADTLYGGAGNDIFYVDNTSDVVVEAYGEGTDIVYASVDFTLSSDVENLTQTGSGNIAAFGNSFNNTMTGNGGNNSLDGGEGRDFLIGNAGDDLLIGGIGADWLQGGDGNDTLIGGAGIDELTGGIGADLFVIDQLYIATDRDTIKDFAPGVDVVALSRAAFTAFAADPLGAISPSAFVVGSLATTAEQHVIYNPVSGGLFYDADGAGGDAAVLIAAMAKTLSLTSADIILIG